MVNAAAPLGFLIREKEPLLLSVTAATWVMIPEIPNGGANGGAAGGGGVGGGEGGGARDSRYNLPISLPTVANSPLSFMASAPYLKLPGSSDQCRSLGLYSSQFAPESVDLQTPADMVVLCAIAKISVPSSDMAEIRHCRGVPIEVISVQVEPESLDTQGLPNGGFEVLHHQYLAHPGNATIFVPSADIEIETQYLAT